MRLRWMSGRPHVRLPTFHGQLTVPEESVTDHKTAAFPFRDRGFCHQFVAIRGRNDKSRPRFHQRNADDAIRLEQFPQRKTSGTKQRRRAVIEPAKIVSVENDSCRITISELDPDSNAIHEHNQLCSQQEDRPNANRQSLSNVRSTPQIISCASLTAVAPPTRAQWPKGSLSSIIRIRISNGPRFSTVCGGSGCIHWALGNFGGSPVLRLSNRISPFSPRRMKWLELCT